VLKGHSNNIVSVTFSADGKYLASGSWDNTVKLWSVDSHKEIATFEGHNNFIFTVAFSPDGRYLASGSMDKTVKLWSVLSQNEITTFQGHT
jgi:WD40 repeat protein